MTDRTITLRGPFTDAEITEFWRLLQQIDNRRPGERFRMVFRMVAEDESIEAAMRALDEVAPVAEGTAK